MMSPKYAADRGCQSCNIHILPYMHLLLGGKDITSAHQYRPICKQPLQNAHQDLKQQNKVPIEDLGGGNRSGHKQLQDWAPTWLRELKVK